MKRIAIISESYARDAQVLAGDPAIIEENPDLEPDFIDIAYPNLFVGVFDGDSEEIIQNAAAKKMGVHSGVISLIEI